MAARRYEISLGVLKNRVFPTRVSLPGGVSGVKGTLGGDGGCYGLLTAEPSPIDE